MNERNLDYQGNFTDEAATNYEKAFYTYMKTGTFGTTPKNCAEGFKKYVTDWGHNCDIINLSDSTYENSIGWLKKNVPFFVTAKNYYFTSGNSKYLEDVSLPQTGRDPQILKIEYSYYEGLSQTHCFVTIGYGYYYLTNIINNTTINKYNINFYKILDGWDRCVILILRTARRLQFMELRYLCKGDGDYERKGRVAYFDMCMYRSNLFCRYLFWVIGFAANQRLQKLEFCNKS